jgi:hypothetical protein
MICSRHNDDYVILAQNNLAVKPLTPLQANSRLLPAMDLFGQAWENLDFDVNHPRKGTRTTSWIIQSWRRLVLGSRKVWEAVFYAQLSSAILGSAIGEEAAATVFKRIHPPAPPRPEAAASSASAPRGSSAAVPSASAPHGSSSAGPSSSAPHGSSSWMPAPLPAYLDTSVTWARGKALSDYERRAPYWRSKASCPHPEASMVLGSDVSIYWEFCNDCGARFQRVPLKMPGVKDAKAPMVTGEPYHLQPPLCTAGHGHLVARTNRRDGGMFWGCPRFPDCTQSQSIVVDGQRLKTYPRYGAPTTSSGL